MGMVIFANPGSKMKTDDCSINAIYANDFFINKLHIFLLFHYFKSLI